MRKRPTRVGAHTPPETPPHSPVRASFRRSHSASSDIGSNSRTKVRQQQQREREQREQDWARPRVLSGARSRGGHLSARGAGPEYPPMGLGLGLELGLGTGAGGAASTPTLVGAGPDHEHGHGHGRETSGMHEAAFLHEQKRADVRARTLRSQQSRATGSRRSSRESSAERVHGIGIDLVDDDEFAKSSLSLSKLTQRRASVDAGAVALAGAGASFASVISTDGEGTATCACGSACSSLCECECECDSERARKPRRHCSTRFPAAFAVDDAELVADAEASMRFDYGAFLKELVVHVLFPLSVPLILAWDGMLGLWNRSFLSLGIVCLGQWFVALAAWTILALAVAYWDDFAQHGAYIEVMVAVATHVLRATLVAVKHGWRRPSLRTAAQTSVLPRSALGQDEIIGGWISISTPSLLQQLDYAAIRQDLNVRRFVARVRISWPLLQAELPRACAAFPDVAETLESQVPDNKLEIPFQLLIAEAVLGDAEQPLPKWMLGVRLATALVLAGVLPAARWLFDPHENPLGSTRPLQAALTLAVLVQLGIAFNFISLVVFAGWTDARRRTAWLRRWAALLFDASSPFAEYFSHHPQAWLLGRRTLIDIGLEFRKRLDVFFGGMLVFVASLIVPLAVLSLNDERSLSVTIFFVFVLVIAVLQTVALVLTSIAGYSTNAAFARDAYRMHSLSLDPVFSGDHLGAHFANVIQGLEMDQRFLALTLLGLTHGPTSFRAVLSLGLFLISVSLRQLLFDLG